MNILRAKQEIIDTIDAYLEKDEYGQYRIPEIRQRPVLLMGPPGIGKTQIMEQIARERDIALVAYTITHHTRQSAVGLPFISKKHYGGREVSVTEYTMSEILASVYDRMEESGKKEGILFIDEINCVSETLAPTMLQFLQYKTFGNRKIPEGWIIVAAGNPPEYNRSVMEFDVVTLDRMKVMEIEPDLEVWKKYAYNCGIHPAVIGYIDAHRNNFFRCEASVDGKHFVTARGWEDLSEMVHAYERLGKRMDAEVTGQYLQYPSIARDFANYLELYFRYRRDYGVDSILAGDVSENIRNRLRYAPFDERLQIISLLLSALGARFISVRQTDSCVMYLHEFLMAYRQSDRVDTESFGNLLSEKKDEFRLRVQAGQNEKQLQKEYGQVLRLLDEWLVEIKSTSAEPWDCVSTMFSEIRENLENAISTAGAILEHAFDFMEMVFGESQEMVIFITELSVNPHAMWFLGEYECPRYYRYNKSLLFEDREKQIRGKLGDIREMMVQGASSMPGEDISAE